jgi:hypothetical protein
MFPVKYVWPKLKGSFDHLYGSGTRWTKPGDVQDVEPYVAKMLLRHPEYEDARKGKAAGTPITAEAPIKEIEDDQRPPPVQLDSMTKGEIAAYVKRSFGVDIDTSAKKVDLIHSVSRMVGMARV